MRCVASRDAFGTRSSASLPIASLRPIMEGALHASTESGCVPCVEWKPRSSSSPAGHGHLSLLPSSSELVELAELLASFDSTRGFREPPIRRASIQFRVQLEDAPTQS